jgi:hypothetical protein
VNSQDTGMWYEDSHQHIVSFFYFTETVNSEHYQQLMRLISLLEVEEQGFRFQQIEQQLMLQI